MITFKQYLAEAKKMKDDPCWDDYEMVGMKDKNGRKVPNCVPKENYVSDAQRKAVWAARNEKGIKEAEYKGREVQLNKPMPGDVKKSKVYVKDPDTGNVKKVEFGDPNMTIKKNIPARRKSFRARHGCDDPNVAKPKDKARYWSCKAW